MRSILRYIKTDEFEEMYNQSDEKRRQYIETLVLDGNKSEINKLIKIYRNGPLESKTLRELRLMARFQGVRDWYHLTRPTLIRMFKEQA